ncbi:Conidiation protein 6-domain-containing protein [Apodospora peruviana]|uniref:Conidiation protein 6-domain-containing protein n=1 Tax=Apodospora peruviana TaxID=516989 RepID=A0AAE0IJA4_9PEZI|nr:Conidiation protein 6-domain-containing protein [Apodospora peruviana]
MADPSNRERGLKAAINNPRVSEQAKRRDREILENEFGRAEQPEMQMEVEEEFVEEEFEPDEAVMPTKLPTRASTGGASKMAKSKSASGAIPESTSSSSANTRSRTSGRSAPSSDHGHEEIEGKDAGNVIRGLKAAISNPNVSEKAKEKDRQKLRDLGE